MVRDCRFALELRADLERAMRDHSSQVRLAEVRQRSVLAKFMARCSYALVRLLMGIAGYGKREYRSAADE